MIAAANADHEVDDEERGRILRGLDATGLGDEERQFILAEIESPTSIGTLASQASTRELARQVGKKPYHGETFDEGPFPVDEAAQAPRGGELG